MGPEYGYNAFDSMGYEFALGFYIIYFLVMLAISVGAYVLQSLGTYTIAKRRGIKHPWLSWIPVGSSWILGCISDQYRYVAKGQVKNKRKSLLVLDLLVVVLFVLIYVLLGALLVQVITYDDTMFAVDHALEMSMLGTFMGLVGVFLIMSGLAIALSVIQYMALYDLYTSCDPMNNVLYLILSIFFSITMPIFVFVCRNKDGGMPPRKPQPAVEPWENDPEQ